jgi:hypothetical protein
MTAVDQVQAERPKRRLPIAPAAGFAVVAIAVVRQGF